MTQLSEIALFQYLVTVGEFCQIRREGADGCGEIILLCREYTCFRFSTIIGPISEVHIVKIVDEHGIEIAIPSICKPGDVTYVVISEKPSAL